jgi:glycosyltransferase involved in cell wall biosynthesis
VTTRGILSIITPAFNESQNIQRLYDRLAAAMGASGAEWEWLIVDDHSRDDTFAIVRQLASRDPRVRGVRLARNSGSHVAIACGLHHVAGDAAIMLAADLQDPPETIRAMLERWQGGAQVVWAVRRQRPGERTHAGFAVLYYWIMRNVVGMRQMPARGADFFLVDRAVIEAFRGFPERNVSVLALITWLGFRQDFIEYDKQPRVAGRSGWTLGRKIKLVVDSIVAFSDLPIRLCWYGSAILLVLALLLLIGAIVGLPGASSGLLLILAAVVGVGGIQLLALSMVGEYVWRAFDEARRRPLYVVEAMAGTAPASALDRQ